MSKMIWVKEEDMGNLRIDQEEEEEEEKEKTKWKKISQIWLMLLIRLTISKMQRSL